jgi:hypothetical protein
MQVSWCMEWAALPQCPALLRIKLKMNKIFHFLCNWAFIYLPFIYLYFSLLLLYWFMSTYLFAILPSSTNTLHPLFSYLHSQKIFSHPVPPPPPTLSIPSPLNPQYIISLYSFIQLHSFPSFSPLFWNTLRKAVQSYIPSPFLFPLIHNISSFYSPIPFLPSHPYSAILWESNHTVYPLLPYYCILNPPPPILLPLSQMSLLYIIP